MFVCVCVVCMCIVYTTTLLSDVERRSAFRRTLYTVSMCVCRCVSEVCSYSMCILHTHSVKCVLACIVYASTVLQCDMHMSLDLLMQALYTSVCVCVVDAKKVL